MNGIFAQEKTFTGLHCSGETFADCEWTDCTFVRCTFENCQLQNCQLTDCTFTGCRVRELTARYSQLREAVFDNCDLLGVNWGDLVPSGRFAAPIAALRGCRLKYNTFTAMELDRFCFDESAITSSLFAECRLAGSDLSGCQLDETEFFKCDLRRADLRRAVGSRIDIMSCQLKGARFTHPQVLSLLEALEIEVE